MLEINELAAHIYYSLPISGRIKEEDLRAAELVLMALRDRYYQEQFQEESDV